jgi:hypothetical protein
MASSAEACMDWFLAELVRRANEGGLSVGVTLCVGGTLVSGSLIGGRVYFERIAESAAVAARDAQEAARARAFLRSPAALYAAPSDDSAEPDDEPLAYIHLAGARFFSANGRPIPGKAGLLWRGRLGAVDGFVLGALDLD